MISKLRLEGHRVSEPVRRERRMAGRFKSQKYE